MVFKNSSYVSRLSLCIFVALCVRISVAEANKVEGTMSWCVETNEILPANMTFTLLKVNKEGKKGSWLWDHHLDSSQFFRLLLRLKVFRSLTLKYLYDSNAEYSVSVSCLRVHLLVWVLLQDISNQIWQSGTVQRTYFIIHEFCFTCFKVEYKRYIFFKVPAMKQ